MTTAWEPEEPPQAILEGEIVPYVDEEPPPRRRRKYTLNVDEDTIEQIILKRGLGHTLRALADEYGVSHETIRIWCGEAQAKRQIKPADVPKVRAKIALQYEAAEEVCRKIIRDFPGTKAALDAISVLNGLMANRSKLLGVIAPVRVDASVYVVTEEERELQEMINEAAAREAAREARVIADATADEDL